MSAEHMVMRRGGTRALQRPEVADLLDTGRHGHPTPDLQARAVAKIAEIDQKLAALHTILSACKKNGIRAALHCGTPDYAAKAIGWGFDMTTVGGDSRFLAAAAGAAVAGFRKLTDGAAAKTEKGTY